MRGLGADATGWSDCSAASKRLRAVSSAAVLALVGEEFRSGNRKAGAESFDITFSVKESSTARHCREAVNGPAMSFLGGIQPPE
jgi:hypothetical protein